jgi:hypothetical protein
MLVSGFLNLRLLMNVSISISDADLSPAEKQLIKTSLELRSDADIPDAIKRLCKSSFMEYVKMFVKQGLPKQAGEIQQERLVFMIQHYYQNRIPCEREIGKIFQLNPSQSKTLLKNIVGRYRTSLDAQIKNTLRTAIHSASVPSGGSNYEFICHSEIMIDELNAIVKDKGPTLAPIQKLKNFASKYVCEPDTFDLLIQELP